MKKTILFLSFLALCIAHAHAQLAINEVSQGASGNKEYIELVVTGAHTCNDTCADLRGWIVDDNGGWYGASAISAGCYRFANVANWSCVPYGSIILLYNDGDKNASITQADDPTDSDHDGVYILPISSSYIELNSSSPNSSMGSSFVYPSAGFTAGGASWTPMALNNNGDAVVTVDPLNPGVAYSAMTYGNLSGGAHVSASGGQKVYYATGSQFNTSAGWTSGSVPSSETPGAANNAANLAWINSIKQLISGGSINVTVYDTICQGTSYIFNGNTYTNAGTYTGKFTSVHGCDSIVTVMLYVRPKPAAPVVVSPVSYCIGDVAAALTASGQNLLWYTTATGGTASTTPPVPATATDGTTVYYVSQIVGGCESYRDSIKVIVKPIPAPPVVTTPVLYCKMDVANLLSQSVTGQGLLWYTAATGGTGTNIPPLPNTSIAGSITWFVSQSPNGCESPRVPVEVIIHESVADFTLSKDSLCATDTIHLINKSTSTLPLNYLWSFGDGSTATTLSADHIYQQAGNYNVKLNVVSTNGCKDSVVKHVKVLPLPAFDFSIPDTLICRGGSIRIVDTFSPGYQYAVWDFGDGFTINKADVPQHAYDIDGHFVISVKARYSVCPEVSKEQSVTVLPFPKTDIGPDTAICPGSAPIVLQDKYYNPQYTYQWNTGETAGNILVTQPGTYWVTVSDGQCATADSAVVFKSCYVDIPNAFTPNDDGINDYFFPREFLSRALISFHMQIFSRWGELIFETTSTDGRGWDGKLNGVSQGAGVYIYMIQAVFTNGVKEQHQGNVTLIR
ncbi:PKD domain-containing protein [Chitinophagaceae bacterium MMS25-I14]